MEPGLLPNDAAIPVGQTTTALMAWRHRGVLRVTVIAKATFSIACDTAMPRTRAQKIVTGEVHHGNTPNRSVRLTTDLVPYMERADVVFTGSAFAPPGSVTESMHVRLGVYDGTHPRLDKTLLVRQKGGFREIPLVYDSAYGGIGWPDNPFGVGATTDVEPSIVDPENPARTVGFGPLSQALPVRKKLLGRARKALVGAIPTLPDEIDWTYFHAAPADQRIDWLKGDEWIVLDGLHPSLPSARTRLPDVRGQAHVFGLEAFGVATGQTLDLHADMVRIDGDDRQVTVTFRGVFPVPDEAALASVTVLSGVEVAGTPVVWPSSIPARAMIEPAPMAVVPSGFNAAGTVVLEAQRALPSMIADHDTHTMAEMPRGKAAKPALPFAAGGTSPLAFQSSAQGESRWSGTLELAPEQEAAASERDAIPFGQRIKPTPSERFAPPEYVAAPPDYIADTAPTERIVTSTPTERIVASAPAPAPIVEAPVITPAPPAPAAPPPPPPPPPSVPSAPQREVSVGVAAPREEPRPAPPPAKPAPVIPAAAPSVLKKGLYGKFGGKR